MHWAVHGLRNSFFRYPQGLQYMKYKIVLMQQVDTDLRGIYEYIAFTLLENQPPKSMCKIFLENIDRKY